jgi:translocation and assembly module TamA
MSGAFVRRLLGRRSLLLVWLVWPIVVGAQATSVMVDANVAAPAASQPSNQRVARKPLRWRLVVDAPAPLDKLLEDSLDLARFQQEANVSRGELRRLVADVPNQARSLLDAEGYFAAQIHTRVQDAQADVAQVTPPSVPASVDDEVRVMVTVEPGTRTRVSNVQFIFEGALDKHLASGDAAAQALTDALSKNWALPEGEVWRQSAWAVAKNNALARLRADTYPLASWSGTSVTVDATDATASLFLVVDSGPAFAFGSITVEGLSRQPASAVANLAPFKSGGPYRERQLLDWQERIQKVGLFDSVFVSPMLDPTQPEATSLMVQVHELPLQSATAGIGISSDNGPRLSLEHLHRNVFGLDWQAKTKVQLGARLQDVLLDVTSHPWDGHKRGLASLQSTNLIDSDNAVTHSQRARVGLLREGERLERSDYVEVQHASVRSSNDLLVSNATALSATTQWIFRDVNNRLLPTHGSAWMAQLTAGYTYSAFDSAGPFGRAHGRVTAYRPLPLDWQLTARGEAGQVLARESVSVPDTLLFRAGGDDSVRGYAYRSLGVEIDGVTTGARAVVTGSLELAHALPVSMPGLQGAMFADVGDAADRFSKMSVHRGYGVGVRWLSPVGPFRLDVAYGEAVQRWRLHFSVGVSL